MFKKPLIVAVTLTLTAFGASNIAMAQLGGFGKKKEDASAAAGADAVSLQDGLVKSYLAANGDVTAGLVEFAKAYDLKDQAAALEASANTLSGGAVNEDKLGEHQKLADAAQDAVKAKIDSGAVLSEDGKKHFVAGLVPFAKGTRATAGLPKDLQAFSDAAKSQISSASVMEKAKITKQLSTGMWLAKQVPGHSAKLATGLQQIVGYAQKNSIPVPKDAKAATDAL